MNVTSSMDFVMSSFCSVEQMKSRKFDIADNDVLNLQLSSALPFLDFSNIGGDCGQKKRKRQEDESQSSTFDSYDQQTQTQRPNEESSNFARKKRKLDNDFEDCLTTVEQFPENFNEVCMLYIECMISGNAVKAFVDSGSQSTIMSQAFAERCDLMRLVDTRFSGVAKGVVGQEIIGKVNFAQLQIGNIFLPCSFLILKNMDIDMSLGMDMLKRHQCMIDPKNNDFFIGTSHTKLHFATR